MNSVWSKMLMGNGGQNNSTEISRTQCALLLAVVLLLYGEVVVDNPVGLVSILATVCLVVVFLPTLSKFANGDNAASSSNNASDNNNNINRQV